jgi:hypothetical protein
VNGSESYRRYVRKNYCVRCGHHADVHLDGAACTAQHNDTAKDRFCRCGSFEQAKEVR